MYVSSIPTTSLLYVDSFIAVVHQPSLAPPAATNMTDPVVLTRRSTPTEIYTVCTSYQQLSRRRSLKPVKNLLRCINAYNNTHHIYNTTLAFNQHRSLTLDWTDPQTSSSLCRTTHTPYFSCLSSLAGGSLITRAAAFDRTARHQ